MKKNNAAGLNYYTGLDEKVMCVIILLGKTFFKIEVRVGLNIVI